ncbi:MAG: ParB/RepB/Spo0J family partition protein [Desulfomonilaceae bacterium]|nr:ParB/RepB/Spo0J family partition protein [Desulfomonilaceae bacterium]
MPKMNETSKRRPALGQGLEALIPLNESLAPQDSERSIKYVPIDSLRPNPFQPRRLFQEESLANLSESIREMGVIQPLIVRVRGMLGDYEIVAGERRWRAAKMAQFKTVPVMVKELSDAESLEIALIENLQREDLNPLDTAEAYDTLIQKFSYTHEVLAKRIGKDRSNITNYLRLLKLPDPIKEHLRGDQLTMAHARTLLAVDHLPTQLNLTGKIIKSKLSVRELEKIVQNFKKKQAAKEVSPAAKDPDLSALEKNLSRHLSAKVVIRQKGKNSGKLEIHYSSAEELDGLLEAIGYSADLS